MQRGEDAVRALTCRLVVLLAAAPIGCARVSSGIQPAGVADTYSVTERDSPLNGGASAAERTAMAEAKAHCRALGREFVPATAQVLGRPGQRELVGDTGVRLTFRCRAADAPEDAGPEIDAGNQDATPQRRESVRVSPASD